MKRLQSPDVLMATWVEGSIQSLETWVALNDPHSIYMWYHVFDFGCSSISFLTHSGQLQLQFISDFPANEMVSSGCLPSFKAFRPVSSIPEFANVIHEKFRNNKKQLDLTSVASDVVVFPSLKVFTNCRFDFFISNLTLSLFAALPFGGWKLWKWLSRVDLLWILDDFIGAFWLLQVPRIPFLERKVPVDQRDEGVSPIFSSCLPLPVIIWAWNFPQVAVKILPGPIFCPKPCPSFLVCC